MSNNAITAQVPRELLELYRILVQNAPSDEIAHQHLLNFVYDSQAAVAAIQNVIDAARTRQVQ